MEFVHGAVIALLLVSICASAGARTSSQSSDEVPLRDSTFELKTLSSRDTLRAIMGDEERAHIVLFRRPVCTSACENVQRILERLLLSYRVAQGSPQSVFSIVPPFADEEVRFHVVKTAFPSLIFSGVRGIPTEEFSGTPSLAYFPRGTHWNTQVVSFKGTEALEYEPAVDNLNQLLVHNFFAQSWATDEERHGQHWHSLYVANETAAARTAFYKALYSRSVLPVKNRPRETLHPFTAKDRGFRNDPRTPEISSLDKNRVVDISAASFAKAVLHQSKQSSFVYFGNTASEGRDGKMMKDGFQAFKAAFRRLRMELQKREHRDQGVFKSEVFGAAAMDMQRNSPHPGLQRQTNIPSLLFFPSHNTNDPMEIHLPLSMFPSTGDVLGPLTDHLYDAMLQSIEIAAALSAARTQPDASSSDDDQSSEEETELSAANADPDVSSVRTLSVNLVERELVKKKTVKGAMLLFVNTGLAVPGQELVEALFNETCAKLRSLPKSPECVRVTVSNKKTPLLRQLQLQGLYRTLPDKVTLRYPFLAGMIADLKTTPYRFALPYTVANIRTFSESLAIGDSKAFRSTAYSRSLSIVQSKLRGEHLYTTDTEMPNDLDSMADDVIADGTVELMDDINLHDEL